MTDSAPVLYGKYQLLERLARGGMAEVFRAKSHGVEGFEKVLVIKRILPELSRNAEFVEMFINEAKIAVTLSHANIVQVFDLGRADETFFIAMEYVAGHDLLTILQRGARHRRVLPEELAVFIAAEVAKALDYAHRRRDANMRALHIVHRDVSPQNVLISFEGEVKLTDFGIARARSVADRATDHGVLKGKYAYMAPEQARGDAVDARTDIYSLGLVLYEALVGSNPFESSSQYDTLRKVREGGAPPLRIAAPHISPELSTIVDRALSVDPRKRQVNAGSLHDELVQYLYSSGRRVSGHDLSKYLDELRGLEEGSRTDHKDALASRGTSRGAEIRAERQRGGRERSAHVLKALRRDATALVVSSGQDPFPESDELLSILRRWGGSPLSVPAGQSSERVALFGLEVLDGRDTDAAARAALRALRAARAETSAADLGVAIHTGRILVDSSGSAIFDDALERLISATRVLARRAPRGTALVSGAARRSLSSSFSTLPYEGETDSHLLEEEREGLPNSGKFVGRRDELRQMGEVLALANRGALRIIGLTGESGIGKTRLLAETKRRLSAFGHPVGMFVATCPRQGVRAPLSGLIELVRAVLGVGELDDVPTVESKVGRLRELGLPEPDLSVIRAALGAGALRDDVGTLSRALRGPLGRIAVKLSRDRLTVLAIDSAEFLDDESQALLDALIRDARNVRMVFVLAYRSGFVHGWVDRPGYHEVSVGRMSDDDVAKLITTRLSAEEVPVDLVREITRKSVGNPLYAEEYLKALIDVGAIEHFQGTVSYQRDLAQTDVPKNLRGIIGDRLARLDPLDLHVLRIAALAGGRFHPELLSQVAEMPVALVVESLSVLEGRGLLSREENGELAFSQPTMADVLREELTLETRRDLHRAIATALEAIFPDRQDELAERLALHWREAGDRTRAIEYCVRAGEKLEAEHSTRAAIEQFVQAIELLSQASIPNRDRMLSLYLRIGQAAWRARSLSLGGASLERGIELADALERLDWVAKLSLLLGRLLVASHRVGEGERALERAHELAEMGDDRELVRDVALARAEAAMRSGDHRRGIQLLERAHRLAVETEDTPSTFRSLLLIALAHATAGARSEALDAVSRARSTFHANLERFAECELLKIESIVHFCARDYRQAISVAERALELAKEYGFVYEAAVNAHNIGDAYLRMGETRRAFAALRNSYDLARDHDFDVLLVSNIRLLGFIDAMRFGGNEGRRRVEESNEFAESRGLVWDRIQGLYYLAMIDQSTGNHELARTSLMQSASLAREHGHDDFVSSIERALSSVDSGERIVMPQ